MTSPTLRSFVTQGAEFLCGSTTPRAYLEEQLAALARWEPHIEAFVHLDLDAARIAADASTDRWRKGLPLSAIDGMPLGIKDIIETANLPTEMGSPLFVGWRSKGDAASVAALREAGAVVVGKTVTTEFAATHPGKTRNPWDFARTPGGSSSGSAAAVGAGILPAALGTQVIGSIIRPASYCGCFGFKPSVGSLNRGGSFDFLSQSAQGVLGATLADIWAVAHAIVIRAGGDPGYPGLRGPSDSPAAAKPARIALLETAGWSHASEPAKQQLLNLIALLRAAGVVVDDRRTSPIIEDAERVVANALTLSQKINTWEFRWPLNTLSRDVDHNGLSKAMQDRLIDAERMTIDEYREGLHQRQNARDVYDRLRGDYNCSITLSAPGEAPVGLSHTGNPIFAVPCSLLGVPALTLPLLHCEGLPLGVQFIGFANEDAALFSAANWILENVDTPPALRSKT
jgi:Asp-tRNA(Asn)/Glu-tRNA(Gln) amidotransferase A subunit family amidase